MAENPRKNDIDAVAIIGAGTMGCGIAGVMAANGFSVRLYSRGEATLARARATLGETSGILYSTDLSACLCGAQFVSESVAEDLELKRRIFAEIEARVPADCLLTTNTSSVPITRIATALAAPERLVGMHWFNPPAVMPLVEIVRGEASAEAAVARARALCAALGKEVIEVSRDVPGFVVNRLQYAMLREAVHLVEAGIASVEDVDRAVETTLAPRWASAGPLRLMDLAGLDTVEKVSAVLMPALSQSPGIPEIVRRLCAEGALGSKSGRGFYDWPGDSAETAKADRDEIVAWISERRRA